MDRRHFLKQASFLVMSSLLSLGLPGWAAGISPSILAEQRKGKKLIVLFQRGGVDGLNVVIPIDDARYYDQRPTIAIPPPTAAGALPLDSSFGLHPALDTVMPLWNAKSLAFVHACGSPNTSLSHLEAQEYIESGTPGNANTNDGWLNRLLAILAGQQIIIGGMTIGSTLPRILRGKMDVANLPPGKGSHVDADFPQPLSLPLQFDILYENDERIADIYRAGMAARKNLLQSLEQEYKEANHGSPAPSAFAANCQRLAKVMVRDPTMQVAFLDVGGWDTHFNQGASRGLLASHLKQFGQGLAALVKGLQDTYDDTLIVALSEFGRTLKENSYGGTDHGRGNALWVLGGGIAGGKVYGEWPGLSDNALAVTSDFRHVLGLLLAKHFTLSENDVASIFPNAPPISVGALRFFSGLIK